jgi:predicted permease
MELILRDLRLAARSLRRSPLLTLVGAGSIAIAVMANTLVFTWMQNLVLDPYPVVREPSRLVALNATAPDGNVSGVPPMSYETLRDWAAGTRSFQGIASYASSRFSMRVEGVEHSDPVWGLLVSGNYFDLLGVPAARGRLLTAADEREAAPVVVISHDFWAHRLGSDPGIIGRRLTLNGHGVTIIGVAAPRFGGTMVGVAFEMWAPVTLQRHLGAGPDILKDRRARWLQAFARLGSGITLAQARVDLDQVARRVSAAQGDNPITGGAVRRMREQFLGSLVFPLFSAMLGITGLVLLIACANVAGLLLARAAARARDVAIQLAVGAGRAAIARRLILESGLLALAGGTLGVLLASWGRGAFALFAPPSPLPISLTFRTDARVVWFAFALTAFAALAFGLVPAWRASRSSPATTLRSSTPGGGGTTKLRHGLVIGQMVFTVVALSVGGLFLKSLAAMREADLGFANPDRVLLVGTDTRLAGLGNAAGRLALDRLLEEVRRLPGVGPASWSTMVPLGFGGHQRVATTVEGYVPAPAEDMWTERVRVADGYFETMGIPIVRGRALEVRDREGSTAAAVVNQALAERFWPGQEPLGKRLDQGDGWITVVGVARNSVYGDVGETPYPVVYTSIRQFFAPTPTLLVRTVESPSGMTARLRQAFGGTHADLPFLDPRTLRAHMGASTFVQRLGGSMLGAFGVIALGLAAIGLYGVTSYLVGQRTRELGVRLALGARPFDVQGLVLRYAARLAALGLVLGTTVALAAGRLIANQLVGVSPGDPLTFTAVGALVLTVALLAAWGPARRAGKVSLMTALRAE